MSNRRSGREKRKDEEMPDPSKVLARCAQNITLNNEGQWHLGPWMWTRGGRNEEEEKEEKQTRARQCKGEKNSKASQNGQIRCWKKMRRRGAGVGGPGMGVVFCRQPDRNSNIVPTARLGGTRGGDRHSTEDGA